MLPCPTKEQFLPPYYTYDECGCKGGWTCVSRHAPEGRGAVRRLRVNYRYYNPVDGRWTRRDPIGIEGGANKYGYVNNFTVSKVDFLGLLVMMECTRYGGKRGYMICSIIIYNDLCKCDRCKKYAQKVHAAKNNIDLLSNINLLKSCANKQEPDLVYTSIPTNTVSNRGNGGIPANEYYRIYPKPSGESVDIPIYNEKTGEKQGYNYHKGTPSPTSLGYGPAQAGKVDDKSVSSGTRIAIRIHPEGLSLGCISVTHECEGKPLTSDEQGKGLIEQLMNEHKSCGGMYVHIVEG